MKRLLIVLGHCKTKHFIYEVKDLCCLFEQLKNFKRIDATFMVNLAFKILLVNLLEGHVIRVSLLILKSIFVMFEWILYEFHY